MTERFDSRPSTITLIADALGQAASLVGAEARLVRLEATEKLTGALAAIVSVVVAAVFMIVALIFLLQGLIELLIEVTHWPAFLASFAVGGGVALIALVTVALAARRLSVEHLRPERTIRQIRRSADAANGRVS